MAEKIGLREKLVPVRVSSLNDLARMAASIVTLGQTAYLIRFESGGKLVYGLVALLRDYYDLYGLPILYYCTREASDDERKKHYLLVKVDEQGEHVMLSETAKPGWVTVPIIDIVEKPSFFPDDIRV
ncbi:cren protein [Pyrolobus fumarii 1A]|uniref:Cren protein n=1 Tax=Pyrolobus fumarii (strain DSM 11204 / 1A) TaxID=694429 RepID=G0ED34_PYRF1|nr:hypothetical protein [Pyrolobus fumarii]AEM38593.1 cren protein [Pyrolobus fumarii 1A]